MKKNYKKNVTAVEKQLVASPAKVYIKRTCMDITLSIAPDNRRQNNREQLRIDLDNIKGKQTGINSCLKFNMKTVYFMFCTIRWIFLGNNRRIQNTIYHAFS